MNPEPKPPSSCLPVLGSEPNAGEMPADPKLLADGWVRRHMVDPSRATETCELYTSLGFDVLVQELRPTDFGPHCQACALSSCNAYVVVYTRKPRPE